MHLLQTAITVQSYWRQMAAWEMISIGASVCGEMPYLCSSIVMSYSSRCPCTVDKSQFHKKLIRNSMHALYLCIFSRASVRSLNKSPMNAASIDGEPSQSGMLPSGDPVGEDSLTLDSTVSVFITVDYPGSPPIAINDETLPNRWGNRMTDVGQVRVSPVS